MRTILSTFGNAVGETVVVEWLLKGQARGAVRRRGVLARQDGEVVHGETEAYCPASLAILLEKLLLPAPRSGY